MRAVVPFFVPCTDPVMYEREITVSLFIYLKIFTYYILYVSVIFHLFFKTKFSFLILFISLFFKFRKIINGFINLNEHSETSMQEPMKILMIHETSISSIIIYVLQNSLLNTLIAFQ